MLGQVRDLVEDESNPLPLNLQGHSITPLHQSFRNYQAEVKTIDEETSVLVLSSPKHASGYRFEIDTQKRVITKQETLIEGKVTSVVLYEDFITTLNRWWPTKVTTTHAQRPDNPNYVVTQKIRKLSSNDFKLQWNKQLEKQKDSLTLSHPLPKLEVARKAVREGDANLAEHLVVMMRYCHFGVWKEAFEQLRSMESLASDKPGMQYIRIALELAAGRKEDARQKIVKRINTFVDGTVPGNPAPQRGDLFLATHLLSSVYPIISWTEYAPVVEKIKPIYDRQSDAAVAQLDWENRWVQVLNALKKHEEKLAFQEGMRQKYFGNVSVQIGYGSTLIELHRREEAKKFFLQQIGLEDHWRHHELTRLRDRYAEMLESNSEYEELLKFLRDWYAQETRSSQVFTRLLTALIMNDLIDQAEELVTDWLQLAQQPQELDVLATAKVEAAIRFAFGNGHRLNRHNGMDRKWLPELFKTASVCIQNDQRLSLARSILQNSHFYQADEGDRLRGLLLNILTAEAGTLPYERLSLSLETLKRGRLLLGDGTEMEIRQVKTSEWSTISQQILERWQQEKEPYKKHQVSQLLVSIYNSYLSEKHLPYLRQLVNEASEQYQTSYREQLFTVLLEQPWTIEVEQEAFGLWLTLNETDSPSLRASHLVPKLYQLVDKMMQNRVTTDAVALQDDGKTDELSRTELSKKRAAFVKSAREALVQELVNQSESIAETQPLLIPWLTLERIRIDIALGRNRKQSIRDCWALLGDDFPALDMDEKLTVEEYAQKLLTALVRERALLTLINLAARKQASEEEIEQSEKNSEALQNSFGKEGEIYKKIDHSKPWKALKYKLLILFDRPDELRVQLQKWVDSDEWNTSWQRGLALLHAEQGELEDAIQIFETLQKKKELTSQDYQTLSNWQLVLDKKVDYETSRIKSLVDQNEWNLANYLNQQANQISNGNGPHELDEKSFLILGAIFEKTSQPENHFSMVRNLYTATRDFRVFEHVPESMLGQTQSKTYQALRQFQNSILNEVRKEATADKMLEHLEKLRASLNAGEVPRGADPDKRSLALD